MNDDAPVVTLGKVYDLLIEVRDDVNALKNAGIPDDIRDHEARIRSLERWVWGAAGIAGLLGVILSQLVDRFLN